MRWAALISVAGALATAIPYVTSHRSPPKLGLLLILLGLAVGFTALQLVPLPAVLAELVASEKFELVASNAQAFDAEQPSFVMASYDPPATLIELAKLLGYLALAFSATRLAFKPEGRRALAVIVVGVATTVALVTIAHEMVGVGKVYGLFVPPRKHPLLSPILNDNHLASLMSIAVPVALVLAITSLGRLRALWLGSALSCAAVGLLIASRGGALGLVAGLIVTASILLIQRRTTGEKKPRRGRISVPAIVIVGCVVVLLGVLAAQQVVKELQDTSIGQLTSDRWKVQDWYHSVRMLEEHLWLGVGNGGFEPAYSRWSPPGETFPGFVENSYLQVVVDWGVVAAVALFVTSFLVVRKAFRRYSQTPLEAGALGGLAALAIHELVDFSIELPIVAMVAILLLAILLPPRLENIATKAIFRKRMILGGFLAIAATVCILGATSLGQTARAAAAEVTGSPTERLVHALDAIEHHPADHVLIGRAAAALAELGDQRALAVMSRALYLNPSHSGLHLLAAQMLLRSQRPEQARVEIALAVRFVPHKDLDAMLAKVVATFPDPGEAADALPLDLQSAPRIVHLLVARHHDLVNFEYTRRLAMLNHNDATMQLFHARAAIKTSQGDSAMIAATEAYRLHPDVESAIALASAMGLTGDAAGGVTMLRTAYVGGVAQSQADRFALLLNVVDLELASGALPAAKGTLDELTQLIVDKDARVAVHIRRARLHDRLGEPNRAKWERDEARKLQDGQGL